MVERCSECGLELVVRAGSIVVSSSRSTSSGGQRLPRARLNIAAVDVAEAGEEILRARAMILLNHWHRLLLLLLMMMMMLVLHGEKRHVEDRRRCLLRLLLLLLLLVLHIMTIDVVQSGVVGQLARQLLLLIGSGRSGGDWDERLSTGVLFRMLLLLAVVVVVFLRWKQVEHYLCVVVVLFACLLQLQVQVNIVRNLTVTRVIEPICCFSQLMHINIVSSMNTIQSKSTKNDRIS